MQHHRGKFRIPKKIKIPDTQIASGSNQICALDITWLNTYTRGIYFKPYMIIDIFGRRIVAYEEKNGDLAA